MRIIKLDSRREMPVIGVKVIDKQYADDFTKKGLIHFSSPSNWADKNKASGHQFDPNEGCYCFSTQKNDYALNVREHASIKIESDGNYRYFSDSTLVLGCCFYGINKSRFTELKMAYGVKQVDTLNYIVERKFFDEFNEKTGNDKAVIIIFDMISFVNRLYEELIKFGIKLNDIHISPVKYDCKSLPYFFDEPFPFEYFLKDSEFEEQSELRVLINCSDESIYKKITTMGCNIGLGDLSKYTCIQDYYDDDLCFSIQGDKLVYSLASPIFTHINEMPFEDLVGILFQVQDNMLPQGVLGKEEIDARMNQIEAVLRDRFQVFVDRKQRILLNVSDELQRRLDAKYSK